MNIPNQVIQVLFLFVETERVLQDLLDQVIHKIYWRLKKEVFTKLLTNPNVMPEHKHKIRELLMKPWNPYIIRHSALTKRSKILKEHVLRQHAGWSPRSQIHLRYIHCFGNESCESILEAYGIVTKDQKLSDVLRPKQCPNCNIMAPNCWDNEVSGVSISIPVM